MPDFLPVTYDHDGVELNGLLLLPAGPGPHPAIMIMHDARGIGPLVKQRAHALASMGFAALVTDMYGGGAYYPNGVDSAPIMMTLHRDPQKFRNRIVGWFETLKQQPGVDTARIAAIGFCFGGNCVLELARSGADVKVVVSYHGLLKTAFPAQPGVVKALVSIFTGSEDLYAPAEDVAGFRKEMEAASAKWQITEYSGVYHAFTDPVGESEMPLIPGVRYDALADRLSWAATVGLLENMREPAKTP